MNCGECRDRLLEADPLEIAEALEGRPGNRPTGGDGGRSEAGWRRHVRACVSCAALAEGILEAQEALAEGLARLTPSRPLAQAVAEASRESGRRRRGVRWASFGAAAAVAAGFLMIRAFDPGGGLGTDSIDVAARFQTGSAFAPEVEAMLDESVVVLESEDEDVVVFWFYQGSGE